MKKKIIYKFLAQKYYLLLEYYWGFKNFKYRRDVIKLLNEDNFEEKANVLSKLLLEKSSLTYYIIRRENRSLGLLTYVSVFLGHIAYAVQKGFVPVIDMRSFPSIYLNDSDVGKVNAWELYFNQPCGVGLDDIPENSKIIYSEKFSQPLSPFVNSVFDQKESHFWKKIVKKYISFNNNVSDYIEDEFINLLKGKKILGLLYRGTDYLTLKPKNHPIQPSVESFIKTIQLFLEKHTDFDGCYIATEDESIVRMLEEKFPNKIIVNKRMYYDKKDKNQFLAEISFNRENDEFLKGLEYLSSIKLLSYSDSIIAGLCAGTYAANFLKEDDFQNSHFFNIGYY